MAGPESVWQSGGFLAAFISWFSLAAVLVATTVVLSKREKH